MHATLGWVGPGVGDGLDLGGQGLRVHAAGPLGTAEQRHVAGIVGAGLRVVLVQHQRSRPARVVRQLPLPSLVLGRPLKAIGLQVFAHRFAGLAVEDQAQPVVGSVLHDLDAIPLGFHRPGRCVLHALFSRLKPIPQAPNLGVVVGEQIVWDAAPPYRSHALRRLALHGLTGAQFFNVLFRESKVISQRVEVTIAQRGIGVLHVILPFLSLGQVKPHAFKFRLGAVVDGASRRAQQALDASRQVLAGFLGALAFGLHALAVALNRESGRAGNHG